MQASTPPTPPPPPLPERNPRTHAAHRRDVLYQITIPLLGMLFILVLLIAAVVWAGVSSSDEVSRWADVSTMWLIAPKLLMLLIQLIMLVAITYGVSRLIAILPPYFRIAQDFMLLVKTRTRRAANQVTEPFLKMEEKMAYLNAWRNKFKKRKDQ
jgi:uncharacterized protein HemY